MGKIFSYSPRRAQAELKRQQRFAQAKELVLAEQALWGELYAEEAAKQASKAGQTQKPHPARG